LAQPSVSEDRRRYVQDVFQRIAPRYDLMNRLMTFGQDVAWRREVIRRAGLFDGARLLDLGAGTGDLGREALRQAPDCLPVLADFSLGMMRVGRQRPNPPPAWSAADALQVPFADATFDAVISGFLLRNVTSVQRALEEQFRVLKPGGRLVALDTTRPGRSPLRPFVWAHMHLVIPALGWLLTGQRDAYQYLPNSTEGFLRAEELAVRLAVAGFRRVGFRRLNFGTIAIHWGEKPA
jgi:demethylmenaquinone methyltransferase / 2-methoxy-6-polyprenyl-1,4-benzoquinol methylase